ncbi:hypothetical protein HDK77DRAFT_424182 [Phyllosticta capitalensis]
MPGPRVPTTPPSSSTCIISPPPAPRRSRLIHYHANILPGTQHNMVSRCGYERSYSEWENTFVNVMALDDDYYTVEYDIDFEYGTDEMEEVSDEMRMEMDGTDMQMESIQKRLQRVHIGSHIPHPAVLSAFRPISLSKQLSASHIAKNTTLEVIMEEDEEDSMETDHNIKHISNERATDVVMREDTNIMPVATSNTMDTAMKEETNTFHKANEATPEIVMKEQHFLRTEMDPENVSTTPSTPRLFRIQPDPSAPVTSPMRTYFSMCEKLRELEKQQQEREVPAHAHGMTSCSKDNTKMTSSSPDYPESATFPDPFPANNTVPIKRARHISDDGEGERVTKMGLSRAKRGRKISGGGMM